MCNWRSPQRELRGVLDKKSIIFLLQWMPFSFENKSKLLLTARRKIALLLVHISLSADIFWYCTFLNLLRIIIYVLLGHYCYKLGWNLSISFLGLPLWILKTTREIIGLRCELTFRKPSLVHRDIRLEFMSLRFICTPAHREHCVSLAWKCHKTELLYIFLRTCGYYINSFCHNLLKRHSMQSTVDFNIFNQALIMGNINIYVNN